MPSAAPRGVGRGRVPPSLRPGRCWAVGCALLALLSCDRPRPQEIAPTLRLFEVRLSSTAAHAPCADPGTDRLAEVRCAERPALVPGAETEGGGEVTRGGGEREAEDRSPDELNEAGRRLLAYAADAETFGRAVARLAAAAERAPTAAHLNDLAAGHYVRAQKTGSALGLVHALDAIERAYAVNPDHPAVAFNRALVRDRFHLLDAAREAWGDYLALDAEGPWAVEARLRRGAIPAEGAGDAEEAPAHELLRRWGELAENDAAAAEAVRTEMHRRAAATADPWLAAVAAALADARHETDRDRQRFARTVASYAEAVGLQEKRAFGDSLPVAERVAGDLDRLGSPLAGWARYLLLRCAYQRTDYAAVEAIGGDILAPLPDQPSALRARTLRALGTTRFGDGRLAAAGLAFLRADEEFARLGDAPGVAAVRLRRAPLADWLGRPEEAWRLRHDALSALRTLGVPSERRLATLDAALFALDLDAPAAARTLIDETVVLALRDGRPIARVSAFLKRAEVLRRSGLPGAEDDLARAEDAVAELPGDGQRAANRVRLLTERGRHLLATSPAAARAVLAEAADLYRHEVDAPLLFPDVLVALARAERAAGEPAAAVSTLEEALAVLAVERASARDDAVLIALAERAAETYRELVALHLDAGDPAAALAALERGRSRRLRERLGVATPESAAVEANLAALTTRLPADLAVVTWALLDDRLATWAWNADGGGFEVRQVGRDEVARRVAALHRALAAGEEETERLRVLHELLLAPVAGQLAGRARLVVVPDGALHRVPFAALVAPDGRFVVESHEVTHALGLLASRFGEERTTEPPATALALVDPAFDPRSYPGFPRLAHAAREGEAIADLYPRGSVAPDAEATRQALAAGLAGSEVVHVAAHGVDVPHDPFLSYLVLAPGDGEGGGSALRARELLDLPVGAAELVVLAACDSAGAGVTRSEGPLGLAWPLLANGVETVVATLWELEDEASAGFFVRFHQAVAAGERPAAALRAAQLESMRRGERVHRWAASVAYAG